MSSSGGNWKNALVAAANEGLLDKNPFVIDLWINDQSISLFLALLPCQLLPHQFFFLAHLSFRPRISITMKLSISEQGCKKK